MKKLHVLATALAMAGTSAVSAQTSVQIYGLIDTAVEHVTNVGAAGNSLTRMPNIGGGMFPSRLGFRGSEDLGGGLNAIFTLENGFAPDSGALNQGNRLFGRQAWVGFSGGWGAVTVGRNYSMLYLSFYDVDIIGPAQFSIGSLDTYPPNARSDNSIAYKGTFGGTTLGATYSLGRDASAAGGPSATNCGGENAADPVACRNWSALARYDGANWGVLAAYDRYHGGTGAAAAFSPTSSSQTDTRTHVAGFVKFGAVKVAGGWMHRNNEGSALTPKSDLTYLGAAYNLTPAFVLEGQIGRLDFKDSANDTNIYLLRGVYNLSKRSAVYGMAGRVRNKSSAAVALSAGTTVAAGGSQNGVIAGIKHSF